MLQLKEEACSASSNLLPIAYCLLPIAYCLLPIAYCLLLIDILFPSPPSKPIVAICIEH